MMSHDHDSSAFNFKPLPTFSMSESNFKVIKIIKKNSLKNKRSLKKNNLEIDFVTTQPNTLSMLHYKKKKKTPYQCCEFMIIENASIIQFSLLNLKKKGNLLFKIK